MAREAKHEQVVLGVVTALYDAKPVVDVELALGAWHLADLTATAASGDELAAAGGGELGGSRAEIVGLPEALAERGLTEQGREGAVAAARARGTQHEQVGSGSRARLVDAEEVKEPGPFQPTRLAGPAAAAKDGRAGTVTDPKGSGDGNGRAGTGVEHALAPG